MTQTSSEISGMFTEISRRYDLANRILSFGLDRSWRRKLVLKATPRPSDRMLDLCTGTADLICELSSAHQQLELVGLDLSRGMLNVGQAKLKRTPAGETALLIEGDVLHLPFHDESFDILSISFGLRNLADREAGIAEMWRVLDDGGRLLILEFSLPMKYALWRFFYKFYLRHILPVWGGILTGSRKAYAYLHDSIRAFPSPAAIRSMMERAGFECIQSHSLMGGIAILYLGVKR